MSETGMKLLHGNADERSRRREPQLGEDPKVLTQALVRRSGLHDTDLQRIGVVQEQLGLGFIEAAMRLGLVTQADLDGVLSGSGIESHAGVPTGTPSQEIMSAHDPFDPYSESIRALRTELLLRAPDDGCNVLAVVSAGAGEGRSRLTAELAVAFSQLGQATLLVDCDLRRPSQHELFRAENDRGLTDALHQGHTTRLQTVVGLPGLALLTAGPKANTPLEMLSAPVFGEMLHGWRRRYRHILLDTPAVTDFSDGLAVATHAARVLAVSRKHHSRLSDARDMLRRLKSARAVIVGAVINEF